MFSSLRCVTVVIRLTVRSLEVITSTLLEIKFTSDDISADYINQCNCNTTRYSTLPLPLALRDPQGRRVRRPSTLTAQAREYHPRRQRSVSAWASDLVLASHSRLQTSCGTSVDSKGSFWVCPVHLNHLYVEEHISIITNLKARLRKFSPMCWPRLLCICGQIANLTSYNLDTLRRCIYANFSFTSHASCLFSWLEEWYRNAINAKYLGQTQLDFNQRL